MAAFSGSEKSLRWSPPPHPLPHSTDAPPYLRFSLSPGCNQALSGTHCILSWKNPDIHKGERERERESVRQLWPDPPVLNSSGFLTVCQSVFVSLLFEHVCIVVSLFRETTNNLLPAHVLNPSLCQEIKTNLNATRAIPQSRYLETDLSQLSHDLLHCQRHIFKVPNRGLFPLVSWHLLI